MRLRRQDELALTDLWIPDGDGERDHAGGEDQDWTASPEAVERGRPGWRWRRGSWRSQCPRRRASTTTGLRLRVLARPHFWSAHSMEPLTDQPSYRTNLVARLGQRAEQPSCTSRCTGHGGHGASSGPERSGQAGTRSGGAPSGQETLDDPRPSTRQTAGRRQLDVLEP